MLCNNWSRTVNSVIKEQSHMSKMTTIITTELLGPNIENLIFSIQVNIFVNYLFIYFPPTSISIMPKF